MVHCVFTKPREEHLYFNIIIHKVNNNNKYFEREYEDKMKVRSHFQIRRARVFYGQMIINKKTTPQWTQTQTQDL